MRRSALSRMRSWADRAHLGAIVGRVAERMFDDSADRGPHRRARRRPIVGEQPRTGDAGLARGCEDAGNDTVAVGRQVATSGKTMLADFPPSSSTVGFRPRRLPLRPPPGLDATGEEHLATSAWDTRASPASSPYPCTRFTTPEETRLRRKLDEPGERHCRHLRRLDDNRVSGCECGTERPCSSAAPAS